MNCRGCGTQLDPTLEQVNAAVEQVLEASLKDAEKKGGVCPLCGHSKDHKKLDLISGRVVEYDPKAYVELHTEAAIAAEYAEYEDAVLATPRFDGQFPCVSISVADAGAAPVLGSCAMPATPAGPVDR